MNIPFIDLKQQYESISSEIDAAIAKTLASSNYIMGPEIFRLEERMADYLGVKFALTCSNGTDALTLSLMALGVGNQEAIITSPFTFFASAESISLVGSTPIFSDIDPDTYNLDPILFDSKIEETLNTTSFNLKGIMPVDLFGIAADFQKINLLAEKHGLFVMEDAAQAFGADYDGKKAGALGDIATTSFYPAKPLGCYVDGGAVFTNDSDLYALLTSLRVHGQATSGDKYDNVPIGMNARMDTIQAAILIEKMKIFDDELSKRNMAAQHYTNHLTGHVKTPFIPENQQSTWAQYTIQVDDREKLKSDLAEKGIPTAIFYATPIHLSTAYQNLGYKKGDFPVAEAASKKVISLPMHPFLTADTIDMICDYIIDSIS